MTDERCDKGGQAATAAGHPVERTSGADSRSRLLVAVLALMFAWGIAWPVFLRFGLVPGAGWRHPEILVSGAFSLGVLLAVLLNRRGRYLAAASLGYAVGLMIASAMIP